ncbi:hypothetical protein SYNPS1DRAFT_8204, partial [Syncephalis pseudoplumigaleata]
ILDLCKRRGFLLPSFGLHNGLRGALDYGPLGVELKRALCQEWWRAVVDSRDDVHGVDTPIMTPREVLRASGHEGSFSDPLVDCRLSRERFRADKAPALRVECIDHGPSKQHVEWRIPIYAPDKLKARDWLRQIEEKLAPGARVVCERRSLYLYLAAKPTVPGIEVSMDMPVLSLQSTTDPRASIPLRYFGYAEPTTNSPFLTEPRAFNLMFRTHIGVGEPGDDGAATDSSSSSSEAMGALVYLRPETAQGIFSNFPLLHRAAGQPALPFGLAQYGKAFRNEIRTEKSTFRTCEFEQLELEYFIPPTMEAAEQWLTRWRQWRLAWWRAYAKEASNVFRVREHASDELAHYAKACYDIEYRFPWGWGEIEGVANRGDHDLRQHSEAIRSVAGLELAYAHGAQGGKPSKAMPWVIEASAGLNRACLVYLLDAYTAEGERVYLRLHPRIAPVQVAVMPLARDAALQAVARNIAAQLRWIGVRTVLDTTSASIGRRYARQDEAGTPWCITVDFEDDGRVTLRERDSMQQTRVAIDEVASLL